MARAAAELERARLHGLFLQAPVAIGLTRGPEHVIELVNAAYCQLTGRDELDLVGKPVREALREMKDETVAVFDRVYRTGEPYVAQEFHTRVRRNARDEEAAFRFNLVPLTDEKGQIYGLMSVAIEVTAQVRARETLERALAEQKRNEELREQLIGIVGHDLRSPLSSIAMAARLLARRGDDRERERALIIARNADRMAKMISQLLDFTRSRLGGGIPIDPRPIDLASLCNEVLADQRLAHPERAFAVDVAGDAHGRWDKDRLSQVVANLLGNAVQYGSPAHPVTLALADEGERVRLSVHNRGAPIPPDVLPVIFEPFRRGRDEGARKSESLGLGLYIVAEIVRAHGGAIEVASTAEEGTTFTVRLPRG